MNLTMNQDVQHAVREYVQIAGARHRGDASGLAIERARLDEEFFRGQAKASGSRFDEEAFKQAYNVDAGNIGSMEGTHQFGKVFEQKIQPRTAFRQFQVDNQVRLGAKDFLIQRQSYQGQAEFFKGGDRIPLAGASLDEERIKINYIVMGYEVDHFEELTSNFAGKSAVAQKRQGAQRAIDALLNDSYWNAPDAPGMYGVLDYPWLAKKASSVTMIAGSATGSEINAELQAAANYPAEQSGGAFATNRMVTSIRMRNWLMSKRMETGTDTVVGKFFTDSNEYIDTIDSAPELKDIGGEGVDGILFYNDSKDSLFLELVSGVQELPKQLQKFGSLGIMFAATGGAVMPDVGGHLLLLVDTTA